MGNFLWRLATCISKHAENAYALQLEDQIEIVLTDWGSETPLANVLEISDSAKRLLKVIYVSPNVAARYNRDSPYSWVHAVNTGVRRCSGKYVLFCDSDGYLPFESMRKILLGLSTGDMFEQSVAECIFLGSRYHVPKQFHETLPSQAELDQFIREKHSTLSHDKLDLPFFTGKSAAYLWPKTVWEECRGLDERMIYWGWSDIDIVVRLASKYCLVDLEDLGILTYHLEHYPETRKRLDPSGLPRKQNENRIPSAYAPNSEDWGLWNETLQVITWGFSSQGANNVYYHPIERDTFYFQLQQIARYLHYAMIVIHREPHNDADLRDCYVALEECKKSALKLASNWPLLIKSPNIQNTLAEAANVHKFSQARLSEVFSNPKFLTLWKNRNEHGPID